MLLLAISARLSRRTRSQLSCEESSDRATGNICDGIAATDLALIDCEMANHPQRFYRLTPEPVAAIEE